MLLYSHADFQAFQCPCMAWQSLQTVGPQVEHRGSPQAGANCCSGHVATLACFSNAAAVPVGTGLPRRCVGVLWDSLAGHDQLGRQICTWLPPQGQRWSSLDLQAGASGNLMRAAPAKTGLVLAPTKHSWRQTRSVQLPAWVG